MKKKKQSRYPDYDMVNLGGTITFGTNLFLRKDKRAIKIIFPCGDVLTFAPEDEIKNDKSGGIS